jgi:hypothetical protein
MHTSLHHFTLAAVNLLCLQLHTLVQKKKRLFKLHLFQVSKRLSIEELLEYPLVSQKRIKLERKMSGQQHTSIDFKTWEMELRNLERELENKKKDLESKLAFCKKT